MRLNRSHALALAMAAALTAAAPTLAVPPDCTGISDVSDFDGATVSDMVNQLTTVRIASGLSRPLFVTQPPGDLSRLFIVEQDGRIKILENDAVLGSLFLDVTGLTRSPIDAGGGDEEGLLGLAFHPNYASNGLFFVYYTDATGATNRVYRYGLLDAYHGDPASATLVISLPNDFTNHNGGMLAFGPDGKLYIASGDGGFQCDPSNHAQDLTSNLGKLLRLGVDTLPYTTTGNPFDGATAGNDEIWAYGLRNPWRFSFDRINGALFIADVGQNDWEEVNCRIAASTGGENYGWDRYEGDVCPPDASPCGSQGSCTISSYFKPVYSYFGTPRSITGGYVYRGCRMSDLQKTYFYADYTGSSGNMIESFRTAVNPNNPCTISAPTTRTADLDPDGAGGLLINSITSFGEDNRGELYMTDRGGEVFKILPNLSIMEVSGTNATAPGLTNSGDWTWEDLHATSGHLIANYKVYRSDNNPTGPFLCVHQGPTASWTGGDPAAPAEDATFYYLYTARNAAGDETRPGNQSDGTPRRLDTASTCP